MEVKLLGDKIASVLAKALVNKLFDSLAVVKIKKYSYTGSYERTKNLVETVHDGTEEKFETLSDTLAKVQANLAIVDAKRWSIQWQVH